MYAITKFSFAIKEPYLHSKDVYRLSNFTKKKLFTRKLCKIDHTHMYIKLHRDMGCWSVVIFERMLWHILGQYIPSYPTNNWLKCSNHPCFWYFGQNSVSLMVCESRTIRLTFITIKNAVLMFQKITLMIKRHNGF